MKNKFIHSITITLALAFLIGCNSNKKDKLNEGMWSEEETESSIDNPDIENNEGDEGENSDEDNSNNSFSSSSFREDKDTYAEKSTFIVNDKSKNLSEEEIDIRKEISNEQNRIQSISFESPADYIKASKIANRISELFGQLGAEQQKAEWKRTAESYEKQSKLPSVR